MKAGDRVVVQKADTKQSVRHSSLFLCSQDHCHAAEVEGVTEAESRWDPHGLREKPSLRRGIKSVLSETVCVMWTQSREGGGWREEMPERDTQEGGRGGGR